MINNITTTDFDDIILKSDKLTMVDLWAPWCGPCHMIAPTIDELSEEYKDNVLIAKCNVDENPSIASKYSVRNIPTFLFFKNGNLIDKVSGTNPKSFFKQKIDTLLQ